jgi:hypothetical protein
VTDHPFTARDDRFHFDQMSDRWWETETCWFSFHNAERKLGGWLYIMVRPNIGTVAGGAWVWDDSAMLPWEVLYSTNYTALRLPRDQDLDDITLPTGVSVKVIEPLTRYMLGYDDPGRLTVALQFDAIMPPHALTSTKSGFGHLSHFDQIGRVHGEIVVLGETVPIDCLSVRDRSWGPRPEHRPRESAYVTGVANAANGFLAVANPGEAGDVTHGFLLRDGHVENLAKGVRTVERDGTGLLSKIVVEGVDVAGRPFSAVGDPVSRIIINRHSFIDSNTLLRWNMDDGAVGYGEDQDCCPVPIWADRMRQIKGGNRL